MEEEHGTHRHPLDHIERLDYLKVTAEEAGRLADLVDEVYFHRENPPRFEEQGS